MPAPEFFAVALVMLLGSALQSAAGFGFGMFAIPLLMLLGVRSYEAITILSVCSFAQTLPGVVLLRRHLVWRDLIVPLALAAICMPTGVWVLRSVTLLEPESVRQIFGCLILLAVTVQYYARITPRADLHAGWDVVAGSASGLMSGMSGMGGPPLVIWIMAHDWHAQRCRVAVWVFFTLLTPIQLGALWQRFGEPVVEAGERALLLAPFALLGLMPGLWIGQRIAKPLLRRISYLLILIIALYAIAQPYLVR